MTEIPIHPRLGHNARRCFCPGCKASTDHISNLGELNHKIVCGSCGHENYGAAPSEPCRRCQSPLNDSMVVELADSDAVPGPLCDACQLQAGIAEKIVTAGGVWVVCRGCQRLSAAHADSPLSVRVRNRGMDSTMVDRCPLCASGQ